jgi:ketosteroid isomerase-like protein
MSARSPEELDCLFSQALNAGDLDALVALYEPAGSLSSEPGQVVTCHQATWQALSAFIAMWPKIIMEVKTCAQAGDIALTTAKWKLTVIIESVPCRGSPWSLGLTELIERRGRGGMTERKKAMLMLEDYQLELLRMQQRGRRPEAEAYRRWREARGAIPCWSNRFLYALGGVMIAVGQWLQWRVLPTGARSACLSEGHGDPACCRMDTRVGPVSVHLDGRQGHVVLQATRDFTWME